MQPPRIETAMTSDDLKYERCVENWFDLTIIFGKSQKNMSTFECSFQLRSCLWNIPNNVVFSWQANASFMLL